MAVSSEKDSSAEHHHATAAATAEMPPQDSSQDELMEEVGQPASISASSSPQMSLSSDEVNYLIFRYLQESGFVHSAFSFAHESMLGRTGLRSADKTLPPGALVTFLQKGLQYVGIEESLRQQQTTTTGKESAGSNSISRTASTTTTSPLPVENHGSSGGGSGDTLQQLPFNFSLLSPAAMTCLARQTPPIQLNVPPATAAAAVKARLAAQAKLRESQQQHHHHQQQQQQQQQRYNAASIISSQLSANGPLVAAGGGAASGRAVGGLGGGDGNVTHNATVVAAAVAAAMMENPNAALARQALAARAAAAMSQMQQLGAGGGGGGQAAAAAAAFAHSRNATSSLVAGVVNPSPAEILASLQQHHHLQQQQHPPQIPPALPPLPVQQSKKASRALAAAAAAAAAANTNDDSILATLGSQKSSGGISATTTQGGNKRASSGSKRSMKKQKTKNAAAAAAAAAQANASSAEATTTTTTPGTTSATVELPSSKKASKAAAAAAAAAAQAQAAHPMVIDVPMRGGGGGEANDERTLQQLPPGQMQPAHAGLEAFTLAPQQEQQQDLVNGEIDRNNGGTSKSNINDLEHVNGSRPKKNVNHAVMQELMQEQQPEDPQGAVDDTASPTGEVDINSEDLLTNVPPEKILRLEMHQSEVFMCAWNPVYTDLIATGSGDASARIWQMGGIRASAGLTTVKLLPHGTDPRDRKNKDVTTLEWSTDGTLLATGSYDGVARVWARNGALIHTLRGHNGPIFSLKWNRKGNYLLSGSYDKTTIVWDVSGTTGFVEQQFTDHQAPALDVDWKDNITFASCSTDKTVHICRVGSPRPLRVFSGHTDEVNAVKWDPSGTLLASCSDDCTAKVWDVESDRTDPLYDFQSHQQEIYTVKWSPTGPGSRHPEKKTILATASFDGSVRLWNIADGSCYRVFNRHRDSVYSVAFSPSGDFLASGSLAGQMYIWNIEQAIHIKSHKGKGDIFEVAWNKEETRVAACFSSNVVAIIDFDRPA